MSRKPHLPRPDAHTAHNGARPPASADTPKTVESITELETAEVAAGEAAAGEAAAGEGDAREVFPARDLPQEALLFLARSAPSRAVWRWLSDESRLELLHNLTRGFQRTFNVLRQPVVRVRLADHLRHYPDDFRALLHLWGQDEPSSVREVRALADDDALTSKLSELQHRHGPEATLLSLLLDERHAALEAWDAAEARAEAGELTAEPSPSERAAASSKAASSKAASSKAASSKSDAAPLISPGVSPDADAAETRLDEINRARAEAQQRRAQAARLQGELNALRTQAEKELRTAILKFQREERRGAAAQAQSQAQLQETQKTLDRTARRLKQSEKSVEALAVENKRLKRQLRQGQQLQEELRKQLANVAARLREAEREAERAAEAAARKEAGAQPEAASPKKSKKAETAKIVSPTSPRPRVALSPRPIPLPPLDKPFVWTADRRPFRVTAREVRRAIDGNDEAFVFTLIQGLDALRQTNAALHLAFLEHVRELGHYYGRVLTADTTRVLVDASNVARYETDRRGKGQLRHLLLLRDELRRRDCFPIVLLADASLPYHIDEPDELLAMARRGELEIAPPGTEADEHLAREARRSGAYVVTNDRSFHLKVAPDFEPPRIAFRIRDDIVLLDDF